MGIFSDASGVWYLAVVDLPRIEPLSLRKVRFVSSNRNLTYISLIKRHASFFHKERR